MRFQHDEEAVDAATVHGFSLQSDDSVGDATVIATIAWAMWSQDRLAQSWCACAAHCQHEQSDSTRFWLFQLSLVKPAITSFMSHCPPRQRKRMVRQARRLYCLVAKNPRLGRFDLMEQAAERMLSRSVNYQVSRIVTALLAGV